MNHILAAMQIRLKLGDFKKEANQLETQSPMQEYLGMVVP